jgi:Cys-tRNA(Pro)/Cys-tRNA(Cys) deacylase
MARGDRPGGGTPATAFLEARGVPFRAHGYAFDDAPGAIALAAAERLGVAPGRLLKCLIAALDDGRLVAVLLGGDRELDLKALARAVGAKKAELAPLAAAERATGYVKGGISPLGQRRALPLLIDRAALGHPTVLVNGGRRGLQLELAPADLLAVAGAQPADLAR